MGDVGNIIFNTLAKIKAPRKHYERYLLKKGDLVMARTGSSRGNMVVFDRTNYELIFAAYLIRFRFKESINPHYVRICFKHSNIKRELLKTSHGGATMNINAENVKRLTIPLPSLQKQNMIVDQFQDGLKTMQELRMKIDDIIEKQTYLVNLINNLSSSILSHAFSGKLVA